MRRIVMAALLAMACAPVAQHYVKPDGTAEGFARDKATCKAQALSQSNAFLAPEIWDACMQGRGWQHEAAPPAP